MPSSYITLKAKDSGAGRSLGTIMATTRLSGAESFTIDDKRYEVSLRFRRFYKPYSLYLIDFTFERYPGTNKPKDFSSTVRLTDPERGDDRQFRIWMNHPLRYRGETLYQSSFKTDMSTGDETATILQVVNNPGWLIPYISCTLISLGMVVHFGISLVKFLQRELA